MGALTQMAFQKTWNIQTPQCGHSLCGSVGTLSMEPEAGEPSICEWCDALAEGGLRVALVEQALWG